MKIARDLPLGVTIEETVWITVRDGSRLAARLWLPEGADQTPVPALLEYIPYRRRDMKRIRDERMHGYFAAHGYACLRVDLRGSGDSEGVLEDEYLEQELTDGEDVLAWMEDQAWCDGNVGMIGISWGGFNALQLAARRPRQLKALIAVASTDDRYADDVHYMGGCLLNDNLSWASVMFAYNAMPPDPEVVGDHWRELWRQRLEGSGLWLKQWMSHPLRDDYWRHGSVCEDYGAIRVPVMIVSGWADGYTNPVFRLVEHLEGPVRGMVGPWSHLYPHQARPGPAIGFLQECRRWWDQWLKGEDTGVADEPRLLAWMQSTLAPQPGHEHRPGRWVAELKWPSDHIATKRWWLSPGKGLLPPDTQLPASARPLTFQSPLRVGLFAGKWCSYGAAPDRPYDQREEDGGSLVFDTEPLEEGLEILGRPALELELAADRPVAMVAVRLSHLAPDDQATRVSYGLLNLCHRDGHDRAAELEPGRRYRVQVPLNHCAHSFPPGHRMRVSISTSYWPLAWTPPQPVRLTVWPVDSCLLLPVRPADHPADEHVPDFEAPERAESSEVVDLEPGDHNWWITHDLAREESRLHVVSDEGRWHIKDIGLTVAKNAEECYRSQGNDFTSPSGEVSAVRELKRGDWHVVTETRTLLTCDREHFYINASLDAWEGKIRVFSRIWNETILRRCL